MQTRELKVQAVDMTQLDSYLIKFRTPEEVCSL